MGLPLSFDLALTGYHGLVDLIDDLNHLKALSRKNRWSRFPNAEAELLRKGSVAVVTTPELKIAFATSNMPGMNGYEPEEVIGQSPKMFQGPDTDPETLQRVRRAVAAHLPFSEVLINYRKNGEAYRCRIDAEPIMDERGQLVNFIAFEQLVI